MAGPSGLFQINLRSGWSFWHLGCFVMSPPQAHSVYPVHIGSTREQDTHVCDFPPLGLKLREPNFTLKRTFKVENTGQLEIHVETIEISGYACEGYGFKVVNCHEFALSANASRDIVIL